MRKSTSRITRLPAEVREEINRKLDQGWAYRSIRKWLFEQVAECDVPALELVKGDSLSLAWVRAAKSPEHAWHHCELALGNWFRVHHPQWLREQVQRDDSMRVVRRADLLTKEAAQVGGIRPPDGASRPTTTLGAQAIEGGNVMMRSVLVDAISTIRGGSNHPRDIAQLANAWARLNQTNVEVEKLQLRTQDAHNVALDEIGKDIRDIPEARELFSKLLAVLKREEEVRKN